jgi:hypothetical protein
MHATRRHILSASFFHPNHTWQEVSFMKLLFMWFSSVYLTSFLLGPNILLTTVLKQWQSMFFPWYETLKFLCIYFKTKLLLSNMDYVFPCMAFMLSPQKLTLVSMEPYVSHSVSIPSGFLNFLLTLQIKVGMHSVIPTILNSKQANFYLHKLYQKYHRNTY